jgi:hypothetical protein
VLIGAAATVLLMLSIRRLQTLTSEFGVVQFAA